MNVLIIGGDGFIGSHVCRELIHSGHCVSILGPRFRDFLITDIRDDLEKIEGDITDISSLQKGIEQAKPEVIIHLAAYGSGDQGVAQSAQESPVMGMEVNVIGFFNLLEAAQESKTVRKVIWSSSSTVFGSADEYPGQMADEQSPVNPSLFYGLTKAISETLGQYYRNHLDLEIVGIRLPLIYGPGRWYKGAGAAIVDIFEKSNAADPVHIQGGAEQIDLMYVKDVADLCYRLASTNKVLRGIYHVKSHTTTLEEVSQMVKRLVPGYRLEFQKETSTNTFPLMDTTKIKKDLGYEPRYTLEQACRDYLKDLGRNVHD